MTIINLTTPMSDDKERERRTKAVIDAIEQYTEMQMTNENKYPSGGSGPGLQTVVIRAGVAACTDRIGGAGVVTHGVVGVVKDPAAEWQAGYKAGVEAAAKALEADARLCDCAALEDRDCACGAWDDYKSITSARAVEIVRELKGPQ